VFVYRDASAAPDASPRPRAENDPDYWYDLLGEDPGPEHEEARGPFEPLQPSNAPSSGMSGGTGPPPPDAPGRERQEAPEQARARKLEQLKDLYLTAEAIGEQNVDKHFDQLLAQQRELISDYFRQPAAAEPEHQQTGGQATPPEGVTVRAEPPRAW
jgi:hypothetical protein